MLWVRAPGGGCLSCGCTCGRGETRFMKNMDWNAIASAYELVAKGSATRIDGDGWKVYRAGTIVRIDLSA